MYLKVALLISLFIFFENPSMAVPEDWRENTRYYKDYYESGKPKAEGWLEMNVKTGYWKFYHLNGQMAREGRYKNGLKSKFWIVKDDAGNRTMEGHYKKGRKSGWWVYYEKNGEIDYKCQFTNGIKNGYFLQYNYGKLTSASRYKDGKKLNEWYSYRSFNRENNLSDLQ